MPQVLIRNLDDQTVLRLKQRAKQRGRSLEAELRTILEESVQRIPLTTTTTLNDIRALFADRQFEDSATLIRADREQ